MLIYHHIWLVVLTILKNMKVNGKNYPIYAYYICHGMKMYSWIHTLW